MVESTDRGPDDEFFVGYFPTPPRLRRFLVTVIVLVLAGVGGLAYAAAKGQRKAAEGADRSRVIEVVARYDEAPYGTIRYVDPEAPEGPVQEALVVRGFKAGPPPSAAALAGGLVDVKGRLFSRDDGRGKILALGRLAAHASDGDAAAGDADPDLGARLTPPAFDRVGEISLRGEIVDAKCFFGSMRPGQERAHRSCAQYCVRGGIPPVLVIRHPRHGRRYFLLVDETGGDFREDSLPYLAVPVEVRGVLERAGDRDRVRVASVRVL